MRIITILISIILSICLTDCTSYDLSRRVVQQGNLLPQEKIDKLKVGMSRNDVVILMGNSLLHSTFNNDRWDYAYTLRKGSEKLKIQHVSLYFSRDRLIRIERN